MTVEPLTGDELAHLLTTLTPREREVTDLLSAGLLRTEVAKRLHISQATVRTFIQSALFKLDLHSQTQLVALWLRGRLTLASLNDQSAPGGDAR